GLTAGFQWPRRRIVEGPHRHLIRVQRGQVRPARRGASQDTGVRHAGMHDVRAVLPRHVAPDAIVRRLRRAPLYPGQRAVVAARLVALLAAAAEERHRPVRCRLLVGVVAGDTAELAGAVDVTPADVHLLELTHGTRVVHEALGADEDDQEVLQRQAG